jgi:hypothetical protein
MQPPPLPPTHLLGLVVTVAALDHGVWRRGRSPSPGASVGGGAGACTCTRTRAAACAHVRGNSTRIWAEGDGRRWSPQQSTQNATAAAATATASTPAGPAPSVPIPIHRHCTQLPRPKRVVDWDVPQQAVVHVVVHLHVVVLQGHGAVHKAVTTPTTSVLAAVAPMEPLVLYIVGGRSETGGGRLRVKAWLMPTATPATATAAAASLPSPLHASPFAWRCALSASTTI